MKGSIVALVSPFKNNSNQEVDFETIEKLVHFHAEHGTSAIVPCGTTGESPTLTHKEHDQIVKFVVNCAKDTDLKVIAGTGSNSTKEAIHFTEEAQKAGADASLVVVPYYNKPTPAGLKLHFQELNKIDIPIIMYNIPGRTGINVSPETTIDIASECANVVGVKASNGNLEEISELYILSKSLNRPFCILSGDDALTLPIGAVGGAGIVSVAANIIPATMKALMDSINQSDLIKAREINSKVYKFCKALLAYGANPMGIKTVMQAEGWQVGSCRLPLSKLDDQQEKGLLAIWYELKKIL
ncbi:MAG: 4-hydroxy-tetrahydrodipicolinate synthase [Bacteroidota bacterium]